MVINIINEGIVCVCVCVGSGNTLENYDSPLFVTLEAAHNARTRCSYVHKRDQPLKMCHELAVLVFTHNNNITNTDFYFYVWLVSISDLKKNRKLYLVLPKVL